MESENNTIVAGADNPNDADAATVASLLDNNDIEVNVSHAKAQTKNINKTYVDIEDGEQQQQSQQHQQFIDGKPLSTSSNLPAGDSQQSLATTETTQDHDEEDEESSLMSGTFEPPFTASLAPFDMELMERLDRDQKAKRRSKSSHKRESRPKSSSSHRFSTGEKNPQFSSTTFIQRERLNSDAANAERELKLAKQSADDSGSNRDPADRLLSGSAGDSIHVKPSTSMTHTTDESYIQDSNASTLLLEDNPTINAQIVNNNNHHHFNTNNHSKYSRNNSYNRNNSGTAPLTPSLPMNTQLAPFADGGDPVEEEELNAPNEYYMKIEKNPSLFFEDGIRSIDYVLVFKINPQAGIEEQNVEKRRVFEGNLELEGLVTERACKEKEHIYFVKIHAPLEVLRRYAEILKLRMPMKELMCNMNMLSKSSRLRNAAQYISKKIPGMSVVNRSTKTVFSRLKGVVKFFMKHINIDEEKFPRRTQRFTAIYSRDKEYLFDIRHDQFFTSAVRSRIVQFILDRQRFTPKNKDEMAFGIDRLIEDSVYCAAYPLHDGDITTKNTMRNTLYNHWACIRQWYRCQPLDYVKEYFGVKIGLYFAWLGFYTYMLLLASIVGVICFIYSWATLKDYIPVKDVCLTNTKVSNVTDITMCPLCNYCNFWSLKETCYYAKITYLIDNPSTVFFAVFMSFWATLFLELWKRYSAEITHRWDLTGFDVHEEHPRPQYLAKLQHLPPTRTDYVTNIKEPTVPFWRVKLPAAVFSFSVVLLLIALAFVAVLAVVIYRMSMLATLGSSSMNTSRAIMVATATAAFMNLCFLYVLNYLYSHLAEYLTELEMWRTQTQFDDSLTLKIYLLQFVNYYSSIFYIAFFKGKFTGYPGDYKLIFDFRQEECSSGGCLTELCIQLGIIMIGKQAFNSILEVIMPLFWRKVLAIKVGLSKLFKDRESVKHKDTERWVRDLKLLEWGPRSLFPEYLEMVLQYGFVTIFVAAFPLAPIFALLNNVLEMRLDAKKLLTHHRRPVSQRVRDIGVWYRILDCIGKLSVITNGFIIAFTSEMIPRWVYRAMVSPDHSLDGYLNFTLSEFRIQDARAGNDIVAKAAQFNITTCRYTDFRNPPTSENKYELSSYYFIILACRLAFVVVFENVVALVMILVRWCIPDMSNELRDQIRREIYITNEIIIDQETRRARYERAKRSSSVRITDDSDSVTPDRNERFIKIEQLLCSDLSQSQIDLIIHGAQETGIQGEMC